MADTLYTGIAIGGPLNGQTLESRYLKGILLVDKPSGKAWLYDYYPEYAQFVQRPNGYDAVWDNMTIQMKYDVFRQTNSLEHVREMFKELNSNFAVDFEIRALPGEDTN